MALLVDLAKALKGQIQPKHPSGPYFLHFYKPAASNFQPEPANGTKFHQFLTLKNASETRGSDIDNDHGRERLLIDYPSQLAKSWQPTNKADN